MSTDATAPTNDANAAAAAMADASAALQATNATPGKGKARVEAEDEPMDDNDDDEEEDENDDDEEEEVEETFDEIDPSAILAPGTRRSARGAKIDYTSPEALAKAGLQPGDAAADDDAEDSFVAHDNDNDMQED